MQEGSILRPVSHLFGPVGEGIKLELYLGNAEYGEVFHAALAMLCHSDVTVRLEPGSRQAMFESFLATVAATAAEVLEHDSQRIGKSEKELPKGKMVPRSKKITNSRRLITEKYRSSGAVQALQALQRKFTCTCGDYLRVQLAKSDVNKKKILVWIRRADAHDTHRNTTPELLVELTEIVEALGCQPVYIGASLDKPYVKPLDLIEFYLNDSFSEPHSIMKQLGMFVELKKTYRVVGSVGMMSGGMDGPTLFAGLPAVTLMHNAKVTKIAHYDGKVAGYHVVKVSSNKSLGNVTDTVRAKLRSISDTVVLD